jgi:transcriptional regulator with XRE-family HTH domain
MSDLDMTISVVFVAEIQRILDNRKMTHKELAEQIGVSNSYISQVFNGHKALNFITIAKIQKALQIKFEITAEVVLEEHYTQTKNKKILQKLNEMKNANRTRN